MNPYRIVLIFLFALSNHLNGQSKFDFGAEISVIRNNYKISDDGSNQGVFRSNGISNNASLGFNARILYKVDKDHTLNISPGLRYFSGFNASDFAGHQGLFIDIPAYMSISVSDEFYFIAGLRLSYLTRLEREDSFLDIDPMRDRNIINEAGRRFFYTPKIGIGFEILNNISLQLSYNKALFNLIRIGSNNPLSSFGPPTSYKNDFYQLSFVYDGLHSLFSEKKKQ